jgi:L-threonylcarbamoyladenylate synthase
MNSPRVTSTDAPGVLEAAAQVIRNGGLVAFPTDTVYGLAADAWDSEAVGRIYAVKDREQLKAIPVLLGEARELLRVAPEPSPVVWQLAERFWPGPLTMVIKRLSELPSEVSSTDSVGVRVPDHPFALALLQQLGPLAVTSANRSGAASPRDPRSVIEDLGDRIDLLVDGGETVGGKPSTVLDCTTSPPRLLRAGPLELSELLSAAGISADERLSDR